MIISICGKSGSGKSTLAEQIINEFSNAVHLDIDTIGHNVLYIPSVKEELVKTFGNVLTNEEVDRKKLGAIVFDSPTEMDKLTDITWGWMQKDINSFIDSNKNKIIVIDWSLLYKTDYFDKCDIKILLDIPFSLRMKRALKRDKITEEEFRLREKASLNYDSKRFDYVLKKNKHKELIEELKKQL